LLLTPIFVASQYKRERMNKMNKNSASSRIGRMLNVFGSAVAVASATRTGHQPIASDLRTLGIDPVQFSSIHRN
jgi:hypothetical protein